MARVTTAQLADVTPCSAWTVQDLIDHMVGGPEYLMSALAGTPSQARSGSIRSRSIVRAWPGAIGGLEAPGCTRAHLPIAARLRMDGAAGGWTGTFMDQLIHTWDLATATGQDATLDADLVAACTTLLTTFLAGMPEIGRSTGLVGPAVVVSADASAQDQLLAMIEHTAGIKPS